MVDLVYFLCMFIIMDKIKIGLLSLYLKLYDDTMKESRTRVEEFYRIIVSQFEKRDVSVVTGPVCRIESEFKAAVKIFEESKNRPKFIIKEILNNHNKNDID